MLWGQVQGGFNGRWTTEEGSPALHWSLRWWVFPGFSLTCMACTAGPAGCWVLASCPAVEACRTTTYAASACAVCDPGSPRVIFCFSSRGEL